MSMLIPDEETATTKNPSFVTFTLPELWMLNDVIRQYGPNDILLITEIACALIACIDNNLFEYTLEVHEDGLFAINAFVRRDMNTPEGASGQAILLKAFRAICERHGLAISHVGKDLSFKEAKKNARTHTSANADTNSDSLTKRP